MKGRDPDYFMEGGAKIKRSRLLAADEADRQARKAAREGGKHCARKTCMATKGAQRGGKNGMTYPCLCACEICTTTRRTAPEEGSNR